jgi:hypothetical protein
MRGGDGPVEGGCATYAAIGESREPSRADSTGHRRELNCHISLRHLVTGSEVRRRGYLRGTILGVPFCFFLVVILKHNSSVILPADMRNLWPAFSVRCSAVLLQEFTAPDG